MLVSNKKIQKDHLHTLKQEKEKMSTYVKQLKEIKHVLNHYKQKKAFYSFPEV